MLLILLVCLMKLVNLSTLYRPRRYAGSSKENRVQNGQQTIPLQQQYQQQYNCLHQQFQQSQFQKPQLKITPELLQKLRLYQEQKKQLEILQQHKRKLQLYQQQLQQVSQKSGYRKYADKGTKLLRGMTEYPLNESKTSHLPQLNHNSPQNHSPHHHPHQQRRPLTTSPNIPHNYAFSNFNHQTCYRSDDLCSPLSLENELTEETLKRNVQIVLNNLDRYNNALRSIILNEQSSIHYNNNHSLSNMLSSPESDFNSNPPHYPFSNLNCSIASSHDFTHDNSDYQWFLDYGYRDGVAHQSILSSLSASYNGIGELSYYEDLAKNIDANLAEVDMESFRAEDIHSLLSNIPSLCKEKRRQEQNDLDNFICKSELLFSPVKESHISVDSLDLDSYPDDGDIILTCKANKDNYTIAFEGSALYSDESFYADPGDPYSKTKQNFINLHNNLDDIVKRKSLEVSMSRSDHAFTTWSKLKKNSSSQLQRYPSGNNNSSVNITNRHALHCIVRKSSSLPNLRLRKESTHPLNVSQAISTSSANSYKKSRNLLPMCQMPISSPSGSDSPVHVSSANSTESSKQNQPAFNLVKLFIKQKSNSSDTCMDVSSGCWPSDASSSLEQRMRKKSMNDSGKGSALSRHDEEGDGTESSYQLDSLDICEQNKNKDSVNTTPKKVKNDLYREVFDSPTHRNYIKECNKNMRSQPLKNPQVTNLTPHSVNNNNNNNNSSESLGKDCTNKSFSDASRTSDNLTQVYCNHVSDRGKIPVDSIARSVQTSMLLRDRFRVVPPSFLAQLNKLGEQKPAPVYVIYPNYALPDLGFVKSNLSDVVLSPLGYKEAFSIKKKQRPASFGSSEEEILKDTDYKHVVDWKSLCTLLPVEFRRRLKNIPEADVETDPICSQKPLFCMTPPLRKNTKPATCDCSSYLQTVCTSSSGSSHPPSSGYRGSSTLLTDSEMDPAANIPKANAVASDLMRNMYVYQYENNRMEGEVIDRPPPSGRTPRGILRRNPKTAKQKRNSMFEEGQSPSNARNPEKRRSLQETFSPENHNIIDEFIAEIEENISNQYYRANLPNLKLEKTTTNYTPSTLTKDADVEARIRAENFLSNVPKSELKYYAEIANILESMEEEPEHYDRAKLKNEVSRALSQKKVSFNQPSENNTYLHAGQPQRFSTPPNSPNISVAALRVNQSNHKKSKDLTSLEKEKQEKISSNRFKRLQIQWELLSKDSSLLLKDLARETETKSGGSTPTSNHSQRSRIPRPVSYPSPKTNAEQQPKTMRSPSRLVPPKKYNIPPIPVATTPPTTATRPKTPSKLHTTPKKTVSTPRSATRTR